MNITTRDLFMNKQRVEQNSKKIKNNHTYIAISVGLQNSQIWGYTSKKQEIQRNE